MGGVVAPHVPEMCAERGYCREVQGLCYQKQIFVQTQAHEWRFEKVPRVLHVAVMLWEIGPDSNSQGKFAPGLWIV